MELNSLPRRLRMTLITEMSQVVADECCDIAAKAAFVIDVEVTMLFLVARSIAESQLLGEALLAPEMLFKSGALFQHRLPTIVHSTKVWTFAHITFIECARGESKFCPVIKVGVDRIFEA